MFPIKKISKDLSHKILFVILSFFFALFLWFQTSSQRVYEAEFNIPLNIKNLPSDLVIINDLPSNVSVRFKESGENLLKLRTFSKSTFSCNIDLSEIEKGVSKYFLSQSNLSIPNDFSSLSIISLYPKSLLVSTKQKSEKEVPVHADSIIVFFRDGFTSVGKIAIEPSRVKVIGAKDDLKEINEIQLKQLVLEGVDKNFDQEIELAQYPKNYINFVPKKVNIRQNVERLQNRKISNLPVTMSLLSRRYRAIIKPNNATVVLSGPVSHINRLAISDISIIIRGDNLQEGTFDLKAEIQFPDDEVSLLEVTPPLFNVIIEKKK